MPPARPAKRTRRRRQKVATAILPQRPGASTRQGAARRHRRGERRQPPLGRPPGFLAPAASPGVARPARPARRSQSPAASAQPPPARRHRHRLKPPQAPRAKRACASHSACRPAPAWRHQGGEQEPGHQAGSTQTAPRPVAPAAPCTFCPARAAERQHASPAGTAANPRGAARGLARQTGAADWHDCCVHPIRAGRPAI